MMSCYGCGKCDSCKAFLAKIKPKCDTLTFAEAMAMDPSEVEVMWGGTAAWESFAHWPNIMLSTCRAAKFRRSRPKRSRVKEMADSSAWKSNDPNWRSADESIRRETIRAVCEYLRLRPAALPSDVEREFLEPR